jgi:DNA repair exonuclease SbcCD ATPase subunit
MATRGRKKGAQPPKTAKERKAAFDSRMRDPDPSSPLKSRRTPGVYYLSKEAKEVLKKHRTVRTLKVPAPSNDSDFLERLILEYDAHSMSSEEWKVVIPKINKDEEHILQVIERLHKQIEELKRRRRELNSEIEVLKEQSANNKKLIAAKLMAIQKDEELEAEVLPTISDLVMAHEELPPLLWEIWVSKFNDALSFRRNCSPDSMDALRREIKDYIQTLNRGLHFQNQYPIFSDQDNDDDEDEEDYLN